MDALKERDKQYEPELERIGRAIGFGNAQTILGRLWDEMLNEMYGVPPGRGALGATVSDDVPPLPKPAHLRRQMRGDGGYNMVPAYTVQEMKDYARVAQQMQTPNAEVSGGL